MSLWGCNSKNAISLRLNRVQNKGGILHKILRHEVVSAIYPYAGWTILNSNIGFLAISLFWRCKEQRVTFSDEDVC